MNLPELMLTNLEADIMLHTSNTGRYVSREPLALDLARRGILFDHGPQALACGDHYFVTTPAGRNALSEWKSAQPKARSVRRKQSPAFASRHNFLDAGYRMPFGQFLKEIWPRRKELQ